MVPRVNTRVKPIVTLEEVDIAAGAERWQAEKVLLSD
jgi:hypothetical protein